MAKRLIDSAELISKLPIVEEDKQISLIGAVADVVTMISECKPIDAAEVVRCRDCRWRGSEQCAMFYRCDCGEQHTWETDDDYCSYGERKGGQAPQREDVCGSG